jgi:predicted metal-dependent phosphoesterase TrpH
LPGYDLHTHTVLSDGTTTPEDNVRAAVELGLQGLGVTDHDTTAPFERAFAAADGTGLEIVPGTEFSAELDATSVHVLGYWVDPFDQPLQTEMDRLRNERFHRAAAIVERFADLGIEIAFERVQAIAGEAPIGRPHIAKAVIESGAATEPREVFDRWLHDGGPAYVPKYAVDPVRAVELIRGAGGVAVVAHPGLYGRDDAGLADDVIEQMAAAGMAGIEADHPDHDEDDRRRYGELARALGLVVTSGSDFHGERKALQLGQATTSRERLEALRAQRGSTA